MFFFNLRSFIFLDNLLFNKPEKDCNTKKYKVIVKIELTSLSWVKGVMAVSVYNDGSTEPRCNTIREWTSTRKEKP